ncbi:MAG: hypothetical protein BroJett011_62890 [Chloroflexota bacterium]|nr:MAG: hypothetical protein BroJett011_62890 [Chloroflexota bacterium]
MALENAIQGARHTTQRITWTRSDGTAQNLTGATLSGTITPVMSPATAAKAIDGTLSLVTAASGIFDWEYGAQDVVQWGVFLVQFKADYGVEGYDLSDPAEWTVGKAG